MKEIAEFRADGWFAALIIIFMIISGVATAATAVSHAVRAIMSWL